jgi:hypothetical protein
MGERRRSSGGSLYKMNKAERARSLHEKGIDETLADTSLTHVTESSVKKKDFAKEVRAQRDIKSFIDNSEVLLDLPEVRSTVCAPLKVAAFIFSQTIYVLMPCPSM